MSDKLHTTPRPALAVDTHRPDNSSTSLAQDGLGSISNGATAGAETASDPPTNSTAGVRVARPVSPSRDDATRSADVVVIREQIRNMKVDDNYHPSESATLNGIKPSIKSERATLDATISRESETTEGAPASQTATPDRRQTSESSNLAGSPWNERASRRSLNWIPTPLDGLIKKESVLAFAHEPCSWHCYEISRLIGMHRHGQARRSPRILK